MITSKGTFKLITISTGSLFKRASACGTVLGKPGIKNKVKLIQIFNYQEIFH
jgi:hypothetical protein